MTSGALAQALWAVLLPFALANLAHWMLPARPDDTDSEHRNVQLIYFFRSLIRTTGILLTALIAVQLTSTVADLVAAQCLSVDSGCQQNNGLANFLREHVTLRAALVGVVLVVPVVLAGVITKRTDSRNGSVPGNPQSIDGVIPRVRIAESAFLAREKPATSGRTLHAMAALSASALMLCGGSTFPHSWIGRAFWTVAALVLAAAIAVTVCVKPPGNAGVAECDETGLATLFVGKSGAVFTCGSVVLLLSAAIFVLPDALAKAGMGDKDPLPGFEGVLELLMSALALLALVLWIGLLLARDSRTSWLSASSDPAHKRDAVPKHYFPWLGGAHAAYVLALASLVGAGLGAGVTQVVSSCLTSRCVPRFLLSPGASTVEVPETPGIYQALSWLWGVVAVVALAGVIGIVALYLWSGFRRNASGATLQNWPPRHFVRSLRRTWFVAGLNQYAHRLVQAVVLTAVVAGIISVLVPVSIGGASPVGAWLFEPLEGFARGAFANGAVVAPWVAALQGLGVFLLATALILLLTAIYNASRRPESSGRSLGVIWDLASFWPRSGHPIVPPAYAPEAITDLERRAREFLDAADQPHVVLCGHSQGSLLMYATALRLSQDQAYQHRISLVTYGSQLQWAYGRAFPNMLSYRSHEYLLDRLDQRWVNLIRLTDGVGGPVLSRPEDILDKRAVRLSHAICSSGPGEDHTGRYDVINVGNEYWLPDPVINEPILPLRGHSSYTADPVWDEVVLRVVSTPPRSTDPAS